MPGAYSPHLLLPRLRLAHCLTAWVKKGPRSQSPNLPLVSREWRNGVQLYNYYYYYYHSSIPYPKVGKRGPDPSRPGSGGVCGSGCQIAEPPGWETEPTWDEGLIPFWGAYPKP